MTKVNSVVLGLGSNRCFDGLTPMELLIKAVIQLKQELSDIVVSSVYCTKPMYVEDQEYFYNMVLIGTIKDNYSPYKLLQRIHEIEASLGRDRSKELRFGPRSIDTDIEFFGDFEIKSEDLQIPHPRLHERAFVLQPLLEILPETADILKGEKLSRIQSDFKGLKSTDVELFMNRTVFLQRLEQEDHNGNTDRSSDTRSC